MTWKAAKNRKQSGSHRDEPPPAPPRAEFFVQQEPDLGRLDLVLPEIAGGLFQSGALEHALSPGKGQVVILQGECWRTKEILLEWAFQEV